MKVAQFTLRGNVAHIQYGRPGDYDKKDVPATSEIKAAFNAAKMAGITRNSLYGSDTQYAPLSVREVTTVQFVFTPPPVVTNEIVIA